MKKIVVLLISLLLAVAGILAVGQPSSAMPCNGPGCTGESTTGYPGGVAPEGCYLYQDYITTPGTPAVWGIEYEFVQKNGKGGGAKWQTDPNWNAQDNPNSQGWTATGNTREYLITPEVPEGMQIVSSLYCPAVGDPADPVEGGVEGAPDETDTFFPTPESPTEIIEEEDTTPVTSPVDAPVESAPVVKEKVVPVTKSVVKASEPVTPVETLQASSQSAQPATLAYTGFDWVAALIGTALLFGGVMLLRWKRKFA